MERMRHFLKAGKPVFDDTDAEILHSGPAESFVVEKNLEWRELILQAKGLEQEA